jgi:hypothetical protein
VRFPHLVYLWILDIAIAGLAPGQVTTATFYGEVADARGAVVPGAQVILRNDESGAVLAKAADSNGEFQFDFLRVGIYRLTIQAAGFKRYEGRGIDWPQRLEDYRGPRLQLHQCDEREAIREAQTAKGVTAAGYGHRPATPAPGTSN